MVSLCTPCASLCGGLAGKTSPTKWRSKPRHRGIATSHYPSHSPTFSTSHFRLRRSTAARRRQADWSTTAARRRTTGGASGRIRIKTRPEDLADCGSESGHVRPLRPPRPRGAVLVPDPQGLLPGASVHPQGLVPSRPRTFTRGLDASGSSCRSSILSS